MPLLYFHPLTRRWFEERFREPTEPQRLGWPAIAARRDALIAAPTGSGKTLAAFLYSLDRLLREALAGRLEDRTYVLYVSPLRALSNDIQRNLQVPLEELLELARQENPSCSEIRALVRTGDTPAHERQRMLRRPPHILVTTPESLYLLLTGQRSREILRGVETVIVDEIHALARDKRGSHLTLSLERLDNLIASVGGARPVRIGLSATQKPMDEIARFLTGVHPGVEPPVIIDTGHARKLDLAIEVPKQELEAVCSHEHWAEIYERLVNLIGEHRSTLIFVNTRRLAERVARQLSGRLGEDAVSSHHGSLSHKIRQGTEQRLKSGELKAVVATASLELGIDIGHIDLVCQIATPRSIATLLQRIGRAGHSLGVVPKGRLFALSRDELLECLALVRAVYEGRLDRIEMPAAPLDILAQQVVATVACEEWGEDELFELCRRAYPYRDLSRRDYEQVIEMLSEGVSRGRHGAHLHRDRVGKRLRARRAARLTAITCGGAIPEIADYRVVTDDEPKIVVGAVHEDFAIESMSGDVFLLGNTSWRIRHVRNGEVVVRDAQGAPPTIPFWLGEAPSRTTELSAEVSRLRAEIAEQSANMNSESPPFSGEPKATPTSSAAIDWLSQTCHVSREGAEQAVAYVTAQQAATGLIPTQERILFERFFDESGGMQLVIHAPFGTRITRAWGLALRKRFCRTFNFELQASASDNGIVLSLGPQHSFPLEQMFQLVDSRSAREILVQALLAVPFFTTRWRWNVTRALAVRRFDSGRRVPPPLQRFRADDVLSAVFPMSTACLENVVGDIEVPDHPLVRQTMDDCLFEATDLEGWLRVLQDMERGAIQLVGLDTREPSPFSHELLNANPYAFLDDAPLEERRARAVSLRRSLPVDAIRDLAKLDPAAIAQVRSEAWPLVRDADELHDTLLGLGILPAPEGRDWADFFETLRGAGRATVGQRADGSRVWASTERWPLVRAIWPEARAEPEVTLPAGVRAEWDREEAVLEVVRGRLDCSGPISTRDLAATLGLPLDDVFRALVNLELQGFVLRGRFTEGAPVLSDGVPDDDAALEWCERRLLARIHRLTLEGLRRQIEPVTPEQLIRFLARHQHIPGAVRLRGQAGLLELIEQLQGFEAPAGHWERYLFPLRLEKYDPNWLDMLTLTGQVVWGRLRPTRRPDDRGRSMKALTRAMPITLMLRRDLAWLLPEREGVGQTFLSAETQADKNVCPTNSLGDSARAAYEMLSQHGALFAGQLATLLHATLSQVEDLLGELAAAGLVTCDGYAGLRSLITSAAEQRRLSSQRRRRWQPQVRSGHEGGRWSLLHGLPPLALPLFPNDKGEQAVDPAQRIENWCRLLLRRYGVMFRDLLARESSAPSWQDLVRAYRTMEARGEIRGGRFVSHVAGEQFALPDVIARLRQMDETPIDNKMLLLPATDPLNLTGRITTGPKVPASPGNRLVLDKGKLVAYRAGGEIHFGAIPVIEDRMIIETLLKGERRKVQR